MQKVSEYIKPVIFLSAIIGLNLGILLAIPIIQLFVIFVFFAVGAIVTVLFKKNKVVDVLGTKQGIIIGGTSGFVSVIFASVSFLLLALLTGSIFSGAYVMIRSFFMSFGSFAVLLLFIFCIAFMNTLFNMGASLLVISLYNGMIKNEAPQKFKVESKK